MNYVREGALCLVAALMIGGCSKENGMKQGNSGTVRLAAAAPFASAASEVKKVKKSLKWPALTERDLIRLFAEEPLPGTAPLIEAQHDFTFLSRLSPKEQVLYAELVSQ